MAINVSLTKELEELVRDKVKSGLYGTASEVVRDALRQTFLGKPTEDEVIARAVEGVLERIARGDEEFIDDPDAMKKTRERVLKKHLETA